jgi:hypothetical protein
MKIADDKQKHVPLHPIEFATLPQITNTVRVVLDIEVHQSHWMAGSNIRRFTCIREVPPEAVGCSRLFACGIELPLFFDAIDSVWRAKKRIELSYGVYYHAPKILEHLTKAPWHEEPYI